MESLVQLVLRELERYNLKKQGKNYRCNSPFRPGSDSMSFVVTVENDSLVGCDHADSDRGYSLYEIARQLGIDMQRPPVENTKRAYAGMQDYAAAHGLPVQTLLDAGWKEVLKDNRPALEFPTLTGKRWRFLDGNKPHYKSQQGYQRCWYGLTGKSSKAIHLYYSGKPLILCNGEISVLTAQYYGLPAIAVTAGEKDHIPHELFEALKDILVPEIPVLVAMDCDREGKKAAVGIAQQIREAGFQARAVDLGLGKAGDLADFCMLYEWAAIDAIQGLPEVKLTDAPQAATRNWTIIHASELKNLPPVRWIVPGEIPEHGVTVLYGASGAGKSFMALDYALKIAQHSPVMYIAGEGESGYRQRIAAWCKHHNLSEGNLYLCLGAVSFMESDDFETFLQANALIKPRIVIIDTLARSMVGADENSTRDMGLFIRAVDTVKRMLNCAVLIIHHTGKVGAYERGNSSLRGAADSMIKLTDEDGVIRVECSKSKDAQPFPSRYVQLMPVEVIIDGQPIESPVMVDSDILIESPTDRLTVSQQRVLEALTLETFQQGADVADLVDSTDISRGSMQRILSKLLKKGFVSQAAKKEPYLITEAGKDALTRMTRMTQAFLQSQKHAFVKTSESCESTESCESSHQTAFWSNNGNSHYQAGL